MLGLEFLGLESPVFCLWIILVIDFPSLLSTMPPRSSWGWFSHSCLQGWFFLIALAFLTTFIKPYLFVHSASISKKDFLFVQRIVISCKVKSLEILFQKDLNLSLSSSKDYLCLLFWDQIYTRSVSTWVKFKFLFRYSLLTTGLMLHSPFDMCLFE